MTIQHIVKSFAPFAIFALSFSCSSETPGTTNPNVDSGQELFRDSGLPSVQPALPVRDCKTSFVFPLGESNKKVEVFGEWDLFKTKTLMTDGLYTGTYRVELSLLPGDYGYKFIVNDNDYRLDPTHGWTRYVGNVENSRVQVEDCKKPILSVKRHFASGSGVVEIDIQYTDGALRHGIAVADIKAFMNREPVPSSAFSFDETTGIGKLRLSGLTKDKYTFSFSAKDRSGGESKPLYVPTWVEDVPFEWSDGNMYFVFTDRFRNEDKSNDKPIEGVATVANYQGGDFKGVLAALKEGYFDSLGVRSIWLSPVNQNTNQKGKGTGGYDYSGYHGYWVTAPREVEEHFGTLDDLKAISKEAHKRGIRILLDLVHNQLHAEHPYFQEHKSHGWFNGDGSCVCGGNNCDWDQRRLDCWFTNYLPDVNWASMACVNQMLDDAMWWLREADVDGFRVDAVKHMNYIASTGLRQTIQREFETGNAKYYLVGETFTGGDGRALIKEYVNDRALWGQFDFPMFWQIEGTFAKNAGTMADLDNSVAASERDYGEKAVMSPFLGNHDVARFLSRAANQVSDNGIEQAWKTPPVAPDADDPYNRLYLAFTFLLTQKGVPLIYYGDEIGLPGTVDPDNRRMMKWGNEQSPREKALFAKVQKVAKARGSLPGLMRGARMKLHTDGDGYVFARGTSKDTVLVAINRGQTNRTVNVKLPSELGVSDGTVFTDILSGATMTVNSGAVDIPFTIQGAAIFKRN